MVIRLSLGAILAVAASSAFASIHAPSDVKAGSDFVIAWDGYISASTTLPTRLKDVSTGQWYLGASRPLTMSKGNAGTYPFEEYWCYSAWGGTTCVLFGKHKITVTGSSNPADSFAAQLLYDYEIRAGDFDGNGYTDILVDRLTPGIIDGSLQTVILEQSTSGYAASVPNATELSLARSYPISTSITVMLKDQNFDGHVDLVLDGISLSSNAPQEMLILYAPGANNVSQPLGLKAVTKKFFDVFGDLQQWGEDQNYFELNTTVVSRPIF